MLSAICAFSFIHISLPLSRYCYFHPTSEAPSNTASIVHCNFYLSRLLASSKTSNLGNQVSFVRVLFLQRAATTMGLSFSLFAIFFTYVTCLCVAVDHMVWCTEAIPPPQYILLLICPILHIKAQVIPEAALAG